MSCISKIPNLFLLSKLLQSYSKAVCNPLPREIPSLLAFFMDSEWLESRVTQYEQLLKDQGIEAPTLDAFCDNTFLSEAVQQTSDKVTDDFLKYKENLISQGPEKVFEESYYNHIAANIVYFFSELENQAYFVGEESLMRILDCSLRDGFFERIMDYASGCNFFNVSELSATCDEIENYCRNCVSNEAA